MIRDVLASIESHAAQALANARATVAALEKLTDGAPPVVLPSEPAPPPVLPAPVQQTVPWMRKAWIEYGMREVSGSGSNPRIASLFRDAGHAEVRDDETAWCAAFVGASLRRAGVQPTGSLMARSYLNWGEPLGSREPYGAIAVFSRGSDSTLGHVNFLLEMDGDTLLALGGNQSDAVTVQPFPRSRLLDLRWPSGALPVQDDSLQAFA